MKPVDAQSLRDPLHLRLGSALALPLADDLANRQHDTRLRKLPSADLLLSVRPTAAQPDHGIEHDSACSPP